MRIAITGAAGRLGAALCRSLAASHEIIPLGRSRMDLASAASRRATLAEETFDVVINCAAITNVDYCETHPEEAFEVNAAAVEDMARLTAARGARLVQISTDYVFDGGGTVPLTEDAPAMPINVYGRAKREGELATLAASGRHLVVRVSWVFGPDRPSFVDAIIKRAAESDHVEAIADKISAPAYTEDLARHLGQLLEIEGAAGVIHLANRGACTWQEYGQAALDAAVRAGVPLRCRTVAPIQLASMKSFIARRPAFTALDITRFTHLTGKSPRPWQDAVEAYVRGR